MGARDLARTGLKAQLDAWATDNPTLCAHTYRARPAGFELPCGFVGSITESITHDSGTRSRTLDCEVQFVNRISDNEESLDWADDVADGFLDRITDNHAAVTGGVCAVTSIASDADEATPDGYRALVTFVVNVFLAEGRS